MQFRCSRRNPLLCGRYRCAELILGVGAFFMIGYLIGLFMRAETNTDNSLLPDRAYRGHDVERIRELNTAKDDKNLHLPKDTPNFVSSLNKTWLTWDSIDSPGVYRACVVRPEINSIPGTLTGDRVLEDRGDRMRIEACIEICIQLVFTYAALSRGSECFCTDVSSTSAFLSYVDNAQCDAPCTGDPSHNCGGHGFMSVYRTAVADPRCTLTSLGSPGSLPLLALASYPRSGNTWTRQLIEKATGLYTGSVYWTTERLMEISSQVFPGGNIDYRERSTICVKTHKYDIRHVRQFEGAVLLIRNPYRAIVAEVFRRQLFEANATPEHALRYFKSKEWESFVSKSIGDWKAMYLQWTQNHKRCLPIVYEALESDTVGQLTRIVDFLNRTVDRERVVCATQEHPSSLVTRTALGNHGRKTRVYLTTDPFSRRMRKTIDMSIRAVNSTLYSNLGVVLPREYLESVDVF